MKTHKVTYEHNNERRGNGGESAWTAVCRCGWQESHSLKSDPNSAESQTPMPRPCVRHVSGVRGKST